MLDWNGASGAQIHRDYVLFLADQLGVALAQVPKPVADRLRGALDTLPDQNWLRLVTAPRITYRLLWPSRHSAADIADALGAALAVEKARANAGAATDKAFSPPPQTLWSAVGDGWLGPDGGFVAGPALPGLPPLDFFSPHALAIDIDGEIDEVDVPRSPYPSAETRQILSLLSDVRERLVTTNPRIAGFVEAFTKSLVLQQDPQAPDLFSTGSSAQYVGRSVMGNPHLSKVDSALLAEGLVHEAIHSLLYMSERLEPWVNNEEVYGPELRTRSEWTGNPLPLRSYLQACFVWYGLAMFWAQAFARGTFEAERARARLEQALRGFLKGHVLDQVRPFAEHINSEVLDTIDTLQGRVRDAL
ncbi:aKG-HExxH-type peptide beta-hydroxylase [Sphingomonas psychrotolerans]|uniref:aKG-HExxH-type peptide beta-hydroxylase n=1 Tax=Sphingomonas psychrotolerans TaxID=1327635 RepID=UPI0013051C81|nr:HEXXH motif-containing putative peptide modification protein [Sphingomonas psychrotolerans]